LEKTFREGEVLQGKEVERGLSTIYRTKETSGIYPVYSSIRIAGTRRSAECRPTEILRERLA
jgi:hypothetical protein